MFNKSAVASDIFPGLDESWSTQICKLHPCRLSIQPPEVTAAGLHFEVAALLAARNQFPEGVPLIALISSRLGASRPCSASFWGNFMAFALLSWVLFWAIVAHAAASLQHTTLEILRGVSSNHGVCFAVSGIQ